ncbi:MAG: hypothetical protein OEZ04_01170 [Nitrospinota bacterium]|nr:hypothetical protein [Nitrospinota bacterium]
MRRQKSVNDFSKKCGISTSLMLAYLGGKSLPGLENLIKLAAAADVSVQWLASGMGPTRADAQMYETERRREEAMDKMDRVEAGVEKARLLAGRKIAPGALPDIHAYAFLNNLGEKQIIDLVRKWGSRYMEERRVDYELLRNAVLAVEELMEKGKVTLSLEKKADIIALVYENSLEADGEKVKLIDKGLASRLINLAR